MQSASVLTRKELKLGMDQVFWSVDCGHKTTTTTMTMPMRKDYNVILDLYTIWDMFGTEQVSLLNFMIGLVPLACQGQDNLRSILQLALELYDVEETGTVTAANLMKVLQSRFVYMCVYIKRLSYSVSPYGVYSA